MSRNSNGFEKPILELKATLEGLRAQPRTGLTDKEIQKLEKRLAKKQNEVYGGLTDWQRCLVARHPDRPYMREYLDHLIENFEEFHGDRVFSDDHAIMAGFGFFQGKPVCLVGHQKGRGLKQKLFRNFGMPRPDGYRKAIRIMKLAEKFNRPVICFIDTPGAFPGIEAEERGQAEAIANNLKQMARLKVPIMVLVIGEGGSGGALALGVGDEICILENSIYSVISPEGCASILWKDAGQMEQAAEALHLTAPKLMELKLVDRIIKEPPGGAHSDPTEMCRIVGEHMSEWLKTCHEKSRDELLRDRYQKFRAMGVYSQAG